MKHDIDPADRENLRAQKTLMMNMMTAVSSVSAMKEINKLCCLIAENALPEGCQAVKGLPPLPEGYDGWGAMSWKTIAADPRLVCKVVATKPKPAGWTGLELLRERGIHGWVWATPNRVRKISLRKPRKSCSNYVPDAVGECDTLASAVKYLGVDPTAITYSGDPADSLVRIG